MPLSRILMLIGLLLLPVGLFYALAVADRNPKHASYVEHVCLLLGAASFFLGFMIEKKRSA